MPEQFSRPVAASARAKLNFSEAKLRPEHFYASLPLCVIDAVFSIGVNYVGTKRTVIAWAKAQSPEWPMDRRTADRQHTVSEFLETIRSRSSEYLADKVFKNRQRTSSKSGILKAEAVARFAAALQKAGIETFVDMEDAEKVDLAETFVRRLPGQASGISFDYFALLGGHQVVKADRMICRFVAEAAGLETVTPKIAKEALFGATAILQSEFPHVDTRLLDSEVWKYESERAAARRKRPETE